MNKYQSIHTDEDFVGMPREFYSEYTDALESIKFINWLIQPEEIRGFARNRPKHNELDENNELRQYNDSRIVVDVTKPHILEDIDFFRERALYFNIHGKYTDLVPNSNKRSEYAKFWRREVNRWKNGLIRESDGEWIPGSLYFYWNYCPIWKTLKVSNNSKKTKAKGERVREFPTPWLGDYLFFHYLEQAREYGSHAKLLKARGMGFEQPNSELIATPSGFKKVGDINVGDDLIDRHGDVTKVIDVYKQGIKDVYEVTLNDGRKVKCGENHLWSVFCKSKGSKNKKKLYTYTTKYLIENGLFWYNKNKNTLFKFHMPNTEPVKYNESDLPIPPYTFGALLGDGSMSTRSIKIATTDKQILDEIDKDLGYNYNFNFDKHTDCNYLIAYKHRFSRLDEDSKFSNFRYGVNPLKRCIVENGWNLNTYNKFIPDIYKRSSVDQRLELIKGLMDTDGSVNTNGMLEFSNSNKRLIEDVAEVLRSLGINCTIGLGRSPRSKVILGRNVNIRQEYRLYIRTNLSIFKLNRKLERCRVKELFPSTPIIDIKKLDYQEESTCFLVDNDEHIYLTRDFIPTSFKLSI